MTPPAETVSIPIEKLKRSLRAEAAVEPTPVAPAAVTRETQIIAIYGKGGIGKSFTLANLSYMMAQQGKKILLIGCDPKSDTTSLLFGGRACPTIIETSSRKKLAGEQVEIGDVCFKRDGVFAMELGGPEVGRGCGGRGIIHGFETLEKLGFHDWGFDYVLLDFLGDAGLVINKDDGTGEAQAFAEAAGIPVLAAIPANEEIRRKSANYEIIGRPESTWGPLFAQLAENVAIAPPVRPKPLSQDGLLGLFKGEAVGRGVTLQPATFEDMCGASQIHKPSLEVVYDTV
jgi:chlorophyllide a reductase subunit X